jgi:hypothetical protein
MFQKPWSAAVSVGVVMAAQPIHSGHSRSPPISRAPAET